MGSHGAARLRLFDYRGLHRYFVTCCTFRRRTWLTSLDVVQMVTLQLLRSANETGFAVAAFCWMPDHGHLLLEATSPEGDLRRMMNRWKQATGYTHRRATCERLWQNGYYDHVLRAEEDTLTVIEYLIANPLRAGITVDVRDYPHWGSGVWTRDELIEAIQSR
jgi:putative transposase